MLVSTAKTILNGYDDDDHIGAMFIDPEEVTNICGANFKYTDELLDSLSRRPAGTFWYTHQHMFETLIGVAQANHEEHLESERVSNSNQRLSDELQLSHLIISVDAEIRPMQLVSEHELSIVSHYFNSFTLPANSSYATLLTELDARLGDAGDHIFFEGVKVNLDHKEMYVSFGS